MALSSTIQPRLDHPLADSSDGIDLKALTLSIVDGSALGTTGYYLDNPLSQEVHHHVQNLLMIAVFGAIGAVSRYSLSGWIQRLCGESFPLGTLVVNVLGCFLLGLLAGLSTHAVSPNAKNALSAGFLGAFTTFSTFGFETVAHLEKGNWGVAAGNVAANVTLGLLAAWLGIVAARALTTSTV